MNKRTFVVYAFVVRHTDETLVSLRSFWKLPVGDTYKKVSPQFGAGLAKGRKTIEGQFEPLLES